jgi:hypothetical protein
MVVMLFVSFSQLLELFLVSATDRWILDRVYIAMMMPTLDIVVSVQKIKVFIPPIFIVPTFLFLIYIRVTPSIFLLFKHLRKL